MQIFSLVFTLIASLFAPRLKTPRKQLNIEQLYRKYAGLVLRRAMRFFKDEFEAEEVVHEVFMKVIEHAEQFKGDASPGTWLYQITTRHCITRIRNQKRRDVLLDQYIPEWSYKPMETDSEAKFLLKQLWSTLDPELAKVCIYYYIDGLTHDEVGRLLDCSGRTIGNRLNEARISATQILGGAS